MSLRQSIMKDKNRSFYYKSKSKKKDICGGNNKEVEMGNIDKERIYHNKGKALNKLKQTNLKNAQVRSGCLPPNKIMPLTGSKTISKKNKEQDKFDQQRILKQ